MSSDGAGPAPLLLKSVQAARMLGVCERTLSELVRRGELPVVRIGRAVRFVVKDLVTWIEKKRGGNGQHH